MKRYSYDYKRKITLDAGIFQGPGNAGGETSSEGARQRAMELRPFGSIAEAERAQTMCADAVYLQGLYGSPSLRAR